MQWKYKILFLLAGALLLGLLGGCKDRDKGGLNLEEPPGIQSLTFEAGSFHGGSYMYEIRREGEEVLFSAQGMNGIDLDIREAKLTPEEMRFIEAWFMDHEVEKWKGFDGKNTDILDGYGFSLSLTYEDKTTWTAKGYERYPKGYAQANPEKLFLDLAKAHGYKGEEEK